MVTGVAWIMLASVFLIGLVHIARLSSLMIAQKTVKIQLVLGMGVATWVSADATSAGVGLTAASVPSVAITAIRRAAHAKADSAFAIEVGVVRRAGSVFANISVGAMEFAVMALASVQLDGRVRSVEFVLACLLLVYYLGTRRILSPLSVRLPLLELNLLLYLPRLSLYREAKLLYQEAQHLLLRKEVGQVRPFSIFQQQLHHYLRWGLNQVSLSSQVLILCLCQLPPAIPTWYFWSKNDLLLEGILMS
jgi:hypothetical protein